MTNQNLVNSLHVDCGHIDCTFFLEILGTQKRALKLWKFPSKIWMICNHGKPPGYTISGSHWQIYENRVFHRSKQKSNSRQLNRGGPVPLLKARNGLSSSESFHKTRIQLKRSKRFPAPQVLFNPSPNSARPIDHMNVPPFSIIILICTISLFSRLQETPTRYKLQDSTLRAGSDYVQVERRSVTFLDQTMSRGEVFGLKEY